SRWKISSPALRSAVERSSSGSVLSMDGSPHHSSLLVNKCRECLNARKVLAYELAVIEGDLEPVLEVGDQPFDRKRVKRSCRQRIVAVERLLEQLVGDVAADPPRDERAP